ncbi:hypothetical protein [Burkholderia pseudomallei]|uniref:hypothetical protein n=1 Tax=Burkholderia pseudomallei TaxID=28450 RepID=UPI001E475BD3|nr:hypothetical protein [Burkholderia pseudomallei]
MTIRLKARVSIAQCGAIGFARGGRHRATPQKTHRPLARRRRPSQAAARRIPIRGKIHGEASRNTAQDFAFAMIPAPERFSTRRVRSRRAPFAAAVHDEAIRPPVRARTTDDGTCAASRERAVAGVRTGATGMPTGSTNARSIHAQARNGHASIG